MLSIFIPSNPHDNQKGNTITLILQNRKLRFREIETLGSSRRGFTRSKPLPCTAA